MMKIRYFASPLILLLLSACGGGGDGGGATPTATSVGGTASKGIMRNAIVTAYAVSNGTKGASLANVRTLPDGTYTLTIGSYTGPIVLELTTDADSRMICDVPAGCGAIPFGGDVTLPTGFTMRSALPDARGRVDAAITPFTDLATRLATQDGLTSANIGMYLTQVADLFDLPPLADTQPVDITGTVTPTGPVTVDAQRYALLSAAIGEMAGGNPDNIDDVIGGLAQALGNDGQLIVRSSNSSAYDLESVLQAASTVADAPAVSSNLDPLVTVLINESLTVALDTPLDQFSEAEGDTSGAVGLASVKGFVEQAQDLIQSILAADNASVEAEVQGKLAKVKLLSEDSSYFGPLGSAFCLSNSAMAHLAQEVALNGSTNTTLDATELAALPGSVLSCGLSDGSLSVTFAPGFTVTAVPASRTVVTQGLMTIQRYREEWSCNESCVSQTVADGSPVNVSISNLGLAYPDFRTAATQFEASIASSGYLETTAVRLDFTTGTGSLVKLSYDTAATLESHLNALDDSDPANDDAHLPQRVQIVLNNATLLAKGAAATDYSQFKGTVSLTLEPVDLPLINGLPGTRQVVAPAYAAVSGVFSSAAGEILEASVSLDLDDDLASQALSAPAEGTERSGLYTVEDAGIDTVIMRSTMGRLFNYSYWLGPVDGVKLAIVDNGCRQIQITPLYGTEPATSGWAVGDCLDSATTVLQAIQDNLALGNWYSSLHWDLSVEVDGEGLYRPTTVAIGSANGTLAHERGDDAQQTDTAFVRGAFSATVKLKLAGSANLDSEVSISGHRTSLNGGDATITIRNNGKWLQFAGSGADLRTATNLTLSNQNGVSIVLNPVALADDDPANDTAELKLNGSTYGKLYEVAGAWVIRFDDNSFTLL